jgi:hypothetical protein
MYLEVYFNDKDDINYLINHIKCFIQHKEFQKVADIVNKYKDVLEDKHIQDIHYMIENEE